MTNVVTFPGLGLEFELNRVAFTIGGKEIYWYGIIIAAGFLLAVAYGIWRAPRFAVDQDKLTDAIFFAVPAAIIGARLYYVIFNPSNYVREDGSFDWFGAISFWDGGLAIYGGVIATVIVAIIYCKVRKMDFWSGMDITVYGLLIGQLVGRWGNFVNVECYGGVTSLPWRMCSTSIANELLRDGLIESGAVYQSILDGELGVHPTFIYESLWNLLGFILLVLLARRGRKFNGQMFLSYVVWYGLGRSVIEGMRTDSLYFFNTGLRSSQILGIASAVVGIALIVIRLRTAGPATPPYPKGVVRDAQLLALQTAQNEAVSEKPAEQEPPVDRADLPEEEANEQKEETKDGGSFD